jgi:thiol-disulfide isomerase/thioredoxin
MKTMKKILFVCCALCAAFSASAQQPFVIEGQVAGVPDSTEVELSLEQGNILRRVATAYVVDGKFTLTYPLEQPAKMAIIGRWVSKFMPIWAEPGITVKISGEDNLLYTWRIDSPVADQQEWNAFIQADKALHDELQLTENKGKKLSEELSQAASDEEKERIRQARQHLQTVEDSIQYLIYDKGLALLAAKDPAESAFFLDEINGISGMIFHYEDRFGGLKESAIAQYNRLTDAQKASEQGQEIARFLFPPLPVEIGGPMVDAELPNLSGAMHKLSDYKGKGKYILLDFWAAWCGPCRMAMPELGETAKQYADRLTVVGINSDTQQSIWAEATEELTVTWVNLSAPGSSEIAAKYRVNGIPHQVVISPEGIVLGAWTGYGKGHLREQLKKYIPGIE